MLALPVAKGGIRCERPFNLNRLRSEFLAKQMQG